MVRATKALVAGAIVAAASTLSAETLNFPAFGIDLPQGWNYSAPTGGGDVFTFRHTDSEGQLKIMSYEAPVAITRDKLRRMTNIDARVPLTWMPWGEFAGYQYAYEERGGFYRVWFLVNGQTLLLAAYESDSETNERVASELDRIIQSLTIQSVPVN